MATYVVCIPVETYDEAVAVDRVEVTAKGTYVDDDDHLVLISNNGLTVAIFKYWRWVVEQDSATLSE